MEKAGSLHYSSFWGSIFFVLYPIDLIGQHLNFDQSETILDLWHDQHYMANRPWWLYSEQAMIERFIWENRYHGLNGLSLGSSCVQIMLFSMSESNNKKNALKSILWESEIATSVNSWTAEIKSVKIETDNHQSFQTIYEYLDKNPYNAKSSYRTT